MTLNDALKDLLNDLADENRRYFAELIGRVERQVADVIARQTLIEDRPLPKDGQDGAPGQKGDPGDRGTDGAPGAQGEPGAAGAPGKDGQDGANGKDGERGLQGEQGIPGRDGRDGAQGLPGETGARGMDGKDGANGRDGTLENLKCTFDGERTVTLCFKDGTPIEGGVIRFPVRIYRNKWSAEKRYEYQDSVTWNGSEWVCMQATAASKPGEPNSGWVLAIKHGDIGRTGPPGPAGVRGEKGEKGDVVRW